MAKVINLRVENILGLAKAAASPNGRSVSIGGENGQGKSSLQQALKMILGGKDFVPPEPVRRGALNSWVDQVIQELWRKP